MRCAHGYSDGHGCEICDRGEKVPITIRGVCLTCRRAVIAPVVDGRDLTRPPKCPHCKSRRVLKCGAERILHG